MVAIDLVSKHISGVLGCFVDHGVPGLAATSPQMLGACQILLTVSGVSVGCTR